MAKKNSIDNATQDLTIDPGAGTDSFVQFDIGAVNKFRTGVDDTDGFYKISAGSALGTSDTFIMTDAGERTMPLNPAFLANLGAFVNNVTGDGTTYTIDYGAEIFDQGGNFNGTTTFTAPVDGRYMFASNTQLDDLTSSMDSLLTELVSSNRTFSGEGYANVVAVPEGRARHNWAILTDMDSGDTATCTITVSGGGLTADVGGGGVRTYFSGHLAT